MDAAAWIYSLLSTDAELAAIVGERIFIDEAPEGTSYPLILMQQIDSVPVKNAFADILMEGEQWQIKPVDRATKYGRVNQMAARIEALMHKAAGSNVISSVLEFKLPRSEKDAGGNVYKSMIMSFRVHTQ